MIQARPRATILLLAIFLVAGAIWYAFSPSTPSAPSHVNLVILSTKNTPKDIAAPATVSPAPVAEIEPDSIATIDDPAAISGTVTNQNGEPVPHAKVTAYNPNRAPENAQTNTDGRFAIGRLDSAKRYRVSAVAPHFNEAVVDDVAVGSNDIALMLEPLSAARGTVIDPGSGAKITDFEIAYLDIPPDGDADWNARSISGAVKWSPVSDPDGTFVVQDVLSRKPFAVAARAKGRSSAYMLCDAVAPGATREGIVVALKLGATISGTVQTDRGAPVADAQISLGFAGEPGIGPGFTGKPMEEVAKSGTDGKFTIDGLPALQFTVYAFHLGHGFAKSQTVTAEGTESRVRLVFPAGGTIEGVVTDAGMVNPYTKIAVYTLPAANRDSTHHEYHAELRIDNKGQFSIGGLSAGPYEVLASAPDEDSGVERRLTATAEVEPGKITFVTLAFAPASASVTVRVTMNGAPLTDGEVHGVIGTGNGDQHFGGSLTGEGTYRAERLPGGAAYVEVVANQASGPLKRAITFALRDGEDSQQAIAFDSQIGITGRVTTLAEGEHAEVIVVVGTVDADLNKAEELLAVRHMASGVAEVKEDGTFRVEGLEPGDYTVIAVAFNPDDDAGDPLDTMRMAKESVTLASESLELDLAP